MRPGDPPTLESARSLFYGMFFDAKRYDFSRVGRFKFNIKLDTEVPVDQKTLSADDFFRVIEYLLRLHQDVGRVDDIDNLGNRRVRAVGELLENQFRIGLVRMERAIKEKMSVHQDIDSAMPHDLINSKPVIAAIKEFFGSSQLSQFMDQTNPLSEVTHKRRLSALGPGGLSRERAGFEVRDVHASHYGRICPIETPEGPNIGLISSLATYARINDYGFIESPYKKVENGRVLDHFRIVKVGDGRSSSARSSPATSSTERTRKLKKAGKRHGRGRAARLLPVRLGGGEVHHRPGQRAGSTSSGNFVDDRVIARAGGDFVTVERDRVDYIDISPEAAGVGGRGAHPVPRERRRQPRAHGLQHAAPGGAAAAQPRRRSSAPASRASWPATPARSCSASAAASSTRSTPSASSCASKARTSRPASTKEFGADIYQLIKFRRSNQNTCITQKPVVERGAAGEEGRRAGRRPVAPSTASWRSAATSWSPSCPGAATTSRTRS